MDGTVPGLTPAHSRSTSTSDPAAAETEAPPPLPQQVIVITRLPDNEQPNMASEQLQQEEAGSPALPVSKEAPRGEEPAAQ